MRIIMLIDMDYFFAQVEERGNPSLKGRPVVVGADPKKGRGRGVVATCNYEARSYGLHSGMPISTAWKKCPIAAFLPPEFSKYSEASRAVMDIFRQYADRFEQMSIDEAYLDVSDKCSSFENAELLGGEIKKEVLEKTGLTCSVGISSNKLVAKIAAGENKPDGLTVVRPEQIELFLSPKKVSALYGIGPKTEGRLNEIGIKIVNDIVKTPVEILRSEIGSFADDLKFMAKGVDNREVAEEWITKSIGRQYTFDKDTKDESYIMRTIDDMIREIYRELKEQDFLFKTIVLKVRYEDFDTRTKNKTLKEYTDSVKVLRLVSEEQLKPFLVDKRKVRLVGVSVHSLADRKDLKRATLLDL